MDNPENTCDFCQRDNWQPDDNLCASCRELLGPDAVTTTLEGIQGVFDMATKALLLQLVNMVPGWQEMMGQPLKGQMKVHPIEAMKSPGMHISIVVRFAEPEQKLPNTKETK